MLTAETGRRDALSEQLEDAGREQRMLQMQLDKCQAELQQAYGQVSAWIAGRHDIEAW